MSRQYCPFHADEDIPGERLEDGSFSFVCNRGGHPSTDAWHWLEIPEPPTKDGLTGLADELQLAEVLPGLISKLSPGWWFEYGLVERAYARQDREGFRRMVDQWSHTAVTPKRYTASSYLAGVLGRLSAQGRIAYHPGRGTGRWSYNSSISYWSSLPAGPWSKRTAWVDVVGDTTLESQTADAECRSYVPGA